MSNVALGTDPAARSAIPLVAVALAAVGLAEIVAGERSAWSVRR
jgi:hypothetical protein